MKSVSTFRKVIGHVIPMRHNGFVPHLLREKQVFAMLGLGLVLLSFVQYARLTNYFGLTADVYPATIVALTNDDRTTNNLTTLTTNKTLEAAAKLKAADMAGKGYFAHTSPDGKTPWYWFAQAGYSFIYAGENLAINFEESGDVETAWLNSPTHRANIMNENFTEMGVATATGLYNGKQTTFVVELFGMPATTRTGSAPTTAPQAAAPAVASAPTPAATPTPTPAPVGSSVAGESAPHLSVLEETPTFTLAQNTDRSLEPGNPTPAPEPKVSWVKRLILDSDKIAGLVIQIILILAIIATMGMVAREYEKRHRLHMAYGTLIAVIMFTSLFVGRLGMFATGQPLAQAPTFDSTVLQ